MKTFAERVAEKKARAEKAREKGRAKFANVQVEGECGFSHRSKLEDTVCKILRSEAAQGLITLDQHEDHIWLSEAEIEYVADFRCTDLKTGLPFWVEAKGFANDKWPLKLKLYRVYGPGQLRIYVGNWQNPMLKETVIPRRSP